MKIKKNTDLYEAVSKAIYDIFNEDIELNDPTDTTEQFIKKVNGYLNTK